MDCVMGAKFESNENLPENQIPVKLSISPTYSIIVFILKTNAVTLFARIQNPSSLPECRQFYILNCELCFLQRS